MKSLNLLVSITISSLFILVPSVMVRADIFEDIGNLKNKIDSTRDNIQGIGSTVSEVRKVFETGRDNGNRSADPTVSSTQSLKVKTQAGNNSSVKNGFPCIEEICIHDEPQNLSHIQWQKVSNKKLIQKINRANPNTATGARVIVEDLLRPTMRKVDGTELQYISRIKGACQALPTFKAQYLNKNGDEVAVRFDSMVSPDGKRQKYIVTQIYKSLKGSKSLNNEQIANLESQAMEKYPDHYKSLKPQQKKFLAGTVTIFTSNLTDTALILNSPLQIDKFYKTEDRFTLSAFTSPQLFYNFPGCGGDRKIKL